MNIPIPIPTYSFTAYLSHSQVTCMQFINIMVHSVEDMNFRVHLQYEFSSIGLDDYLEVRWKYFVSFRSRLTRSDQFYLQKTNFCTGIPRKMMFKFGLSRLDCKQTNGGPFIYNSVADSLNFNIIFLRFEFEICRGDKFEYQYEIFLIITIIQKFRKNMRPLRA